MDAFLQLQNYRLAYWRASDQDLSYRRFFDINSLIGLRVEQRAAFFWRPTNASCAGCATASSTVYGWKPCGWASRSAAVFRAAAKDRAQRLGGC